MKKLMKICFIIMFIALSVLSIINYSIYSVERIEEGKTSLFINKPNAVSNPEFLEMISNVLSDKNIDIMYRYVEVKENKAHYIYYKTNFKNGFLQLGVGQPDLIASGYTLSTSPRNGSLGKELNVSNVHQEITIGYWMDADKYDLSSGTYFVNTDDLEETTRAITDVGFQVTIDSKAAISGQLSLLLFGFVPGIMMIASMFYYIISIAKKNVLKKIDGYSSTEIAKNEMIYMCKNMILILIIVELFALSFAYWLFRNAIFDYFIFSTKYIIIGLVVGVTGMLFSSLLIYSQNKIELIKGKVPKKSIYYISMLAKCVFIVFITFFLSIAVRNAMQYQATYLTSGKLTQKVNGYVTIPIYDRNRSAEGLDEQYLKFYNETVDKYDGIIIDASNFAFNTMTGKTASEEYGQDYIIINTNYLSFNPILDENGKQISPVHLDMNKPNILYPNSKKDAIVRYTEKGMRWFGIEPNFISYDTDKSVISSYNARIAGENFGVLESPVVVIGDNRLINKDFIVSYISDGSYFFKPATDDPYNELLPLIISSGIENTTLHLPYISSTFSEMLYQQSQMLILYGTQSTLLLIGMLCLVIFTVILFTENYKERISFSIIEGSTILGTMKQHLALTIVQYSAGFGAIFAIAFLTSLRLDFTLLIIVGVIDCLITLLASSKFARANLYSIIKGA